MGASKIIVIIIFNRFNVDFIYKSIYVYVLRAHLYFCHSSCQSCFCAVKFVFLSLWSVKHSNTLQSLELWTRGWSDPHVYSPHSVFLTDAYLISTWLSQNFVGWAWGTDVWCCCRYQRRLYAEEYLQDNVVFSFSTAFTSVRSGVMLSAHVMSKWNEK